MDRSASAVALSEVPDSDRPTLPRPAARVRALRRIDLTALAALAGLTALAQVHLFAPDTLVSLDSATQFYPWYSFLGQSLRDGHIPGWNPANFSGTPFAANPLSGWTYLPAMLLFTLLPLAQAARMYLMLHPMLAVGSTYAFARAVGLARAGSFIAALAYANSGFFQIQNSCCFAFASVYAWLPLTLLGAEQAVRSSRWLSRGNWWGLAALGMSQILAAWLGQGAYYAFLLVGGYIAYRTLLVPPQGVVGGLLIRTGRMLLHAGVIFLFGAALEAAGLLPRLEFNALSNLAGGYAGDNTRVGGLRPDQWVFLATPGFWYVGVSTLALAVMAVVRLRGAMPAPLWYFGATSLLAVLLTNTLETPLDRLLYLVLPGFTSLHPHAPERILTVAYLGPALLAGASISALHKTRWWTRVVASSGQRSVVVIGLLVLFVGVDLGAGGAKARSDRRLIDPSDGIERLTGVDLSTFYQADPAALFLQQRLAESPSRYAGYAPAVDGHLVAYTVRFMDPDIRALNVNNRAIVLGLQDVQGYDPSHLVRYDAYLTALNGQSQDYHDAELFPQSLSSPLLDLLNVRFLIVPAGDPSNRPGLAHFSVNMYQDERVHILENPSAFPRAWIVHDASLAAPQAALAAIAAGEVDARRTALLEGPLPLLEQPPAVSVDRARVKLNEADRLAITTRTQAPGLLVLSELYYPGWKAYVDGERVRLYVADAALRAVPVPPGEHVVELRFESDALAAGVLVSIVASLVLASLAVLWFAKTKRARH